MKENVTNCLKMLKMKKKLKKKIVKVFLKIFKNAKTSIKRKKNVKKCQPYRICKKIQKMLKDV